MRRLLSFIVICALFLVFVVLNLGNTGTVSLGFRELSNIPVFLIAFSSFVLGMLFAVPFVLSLNNKRQKKPPKDMPVPFAGEAKKDSDPHEAE